MESNEIIKMERKSEVFFALHENEKFMLDLGFAGIKKILTAFRRKRKVVWIIILEDLFYGVKMEIEVL